MTDVGFNKMQNVPIRNKSHGEVKFLRNLVIIVCLNFILFNDAIAQALTEKSLQELMKPVMNAYRKENYEEALKLIEKAILQAPKDERLAKFRGEIILKISDQSRKK